MAEQVSPDMLISNFTAPIFFGTLFNWALLGTLVLQVYIFYNNYPNDKGAIKALVYGLLTLDIAQTVCTTIMSYNTLVAGWGDISALLRHPWPAATIPLLTGLVSAIVQIYFAWRIWILKSERKVYRYVAWLIVTIAVMQGISGVVGGIMFADLDDVSQLGRLTIPAEVWLIGSFVCDIVIATTMVIILTEMRRMSPWKRTDRILRRLTYHTVETGLITAVTAGVDLALFLVSTESYLHLLLSLVLAKLYSNVVMAGLNGRQKPRLSNIIETSPLDNQRLSISWARGPDDLNAAETGKIEIDKGAMELQTKFDVDRDGESSSSAQPSPV